MTETRVKEDSASSSRPTRNDADRGPFWLFGLFSAFGRFVREIVSELRKVVYPSRQELITYTIVVVIFVVIMVSIVAGLDIGFAKLVLWIFG